MPLKVEADQELVKLLEDYRQRTIYSSDEATTEFNFCWTLILVAAQHWRGAERRELGPEFVPDGLSSLARKAKALLGE